MFARSISEAGAQQRRWRGVDRRWRVSGLFGKPAAYTGIVAAVTGFVGAFYLAFPPLQWLLLLCSIAYPLWGVLAGAWLFRLP